MRARCEEREEKTTYDMLNIEDESPFMPVPLYKSEPTLLRGSAPSETLISLMCAKIPSKTEVSKARRQNRRSFSKLGCLRMPSKRTRFFTSHAKVRLWAMVLHLAGRLLKTVLPALPTEEPKEAALWQARVVSSSACWSDFCLWHLSAAVKLQKLDVADISVYLFRANSYEQKAVEGQKDRNIEWGSNARLLISMAANTGIF